MRKLLLVQVILMLGSLQSFSQTSAEVHLNNMREFQRQGKFGEAIGELSKAIALQPDNPQYLIDRARLHALVKDFPSLEADVEKAVALAPDNERIAFGAVQILGLSRQCDRALTIVDDFINRNPKNDVLYMARADANFCLKNLPAALLDIQMAIELKPESSNHRATQARLLSAMGNSENALEIFHNVIESLEARLAGENKPQMKLVRGTELAMIYNQRALVFERGEQFDNAIADYSRAFEITSSPQYLRNRAGAYQKTKKYQAAIADLDRVIAEDKRPHALVFQWRGDLHMMAGNYEKAISDFENALKLGTPMPAIIESKIAAAKQKLGLVQQ